MVQALMFAVAAASMLGALGFGLVSLFAGDDATTWRRVAAATGPSATRIRATAIGAAGGPLHAPRSGSACCWYAVWATETTRGLGSTNRSSGGHVAVFERSTTPIVLDCDGGVQLMLDADRTWVEPGPGQTTYRTEHGVPFGAAPQHRALAAWPAMTTWAEFSMREPVAFREPPAIGEVWLELGAVVDVYGTPTRTADGTPTLGPARGVDGVVVLRAGSSTAAVAGERVAASTRRKRLRGRTAIVLGCSFLLFAVLGGVLAG